MRPAAQPWNRPTAANEWHAAPVSGGGSGWTAPRSSFASPAQRITEAWENYEDQKLGGAAAGVQSGVPAPGWSNRINDPAVLAGLEKNRKAAKKAGAFIIPLPLIGFIIYGAVSSEMEMGKAVLIGAIVSVIFLIFTLIGKKKSDPKNSYEAVVTNKQTRRRRDRSGNDDDYTYHTELITVVQTTTGETKKITERDDSGNHIAWDYLQVGDRFRYHAQLSFPYELYDKSRAPYLACPVCSKKHAVTEDRCRKCGAPLLK